MKIYLRSIYTVLIASFTLSACTDVIEVAVPEALPRLVIEASIDWEKGTLGNNQTIKLSTSTPYFDQTSNSTVVGASVKIIQDDSGAEFIFVDENNGSYTTNSFVPEIAAAYTLEIVYNGDLYRAHETSIPVAAIEEVYQTLDKRTPDLLEVNIDFIDPVDEENFYLFKVKEEADLLAELLDLKDEFVNGNLINLFNERDEDEDINQFPYKAGDIVSIELYGISKNYYEYISLLIDQSQNQGNPFGTTPVPLKGNCINTSNSENYAFGYFRVTEVVKATYTFE
jgi:hypothetical protein